MSPGEWNFVWFAAIFGGLVLPYSSKHSPSSTVTHELVLRSIVQRGMRLTMPRRQIVEALLARTGQFTAEELYQSLRRPDHGVGRATVYRTLELLAESGYVQKLHLEQGCHSYIMCGNNHHHHLVCGECGTFVELDECELDATLRRLGSKTGYEITDHFFEVFGRCVDCQASA